METYSGDMTTSTQTLFLSFLGGESLSFAILAWGLAGDDA
jgi:hypothetical protein